MAKCMMVQSLRQFQDVFEVWEVSDHTLAGVFQNEKHPAAKSYEHTDGTLHSDHVVKFYPI